MLYYQQLQEIGRRRVQGDLDGALVGGGDAEGGGVELAGVDLLRVLDRVEYLSFSGERPRLFGAPEREHEIASGHGIAVRPSGVCSQLEPVSEAVLAHRPGLRDARRDVALWVQHHKAFEQITMLYVEFGSHEGLVRIE